MPLKKLRRDLSCKSKLSRSLLPFSKFENFRSVVASLRATPWLQSHPSFFLEAFSGSFRVGPQLPFEVEQQFVIARIIAQLTRVL